LTAKIINDFSTIQGNNCIMSCVKNILNFYTKRFIDESDIFLIGNGFKIEYTTTNTNILLTSRVFKVAMMFLNNVGLNYEIKRFEKSKDAISAIKKNIDDNIPVIVQLVAKDLDYVNVFGGGENVFHYFNVIGYENHEGTFLISDSYVPTIPPSLFNNFYDIKKVEKSMAGAGNLIVIIRPNENDLVRFNNVYNKYFISNSVKKCLHEYLTIEYDDSGTFYNLFALKKLSEDIVSFREIYKDDFTKKMIMLNIMIKRYGLIHSRQYLLDYLKKEKFNYNSLIQSLNEIINKWNHICSIMIRASVTQRKDSLKLLSKQIYELSIYEETILKEIYDNL